MRVRSWTAGWARRVGTAVVVPDARLPMLGAAAWVAALAGLAWQPTWLAAAGAGGVAGAVAYWWWTRRGAGAGRGGAGGCAALVLVALAVGLAAQVRVHRVSHNPLAALASARAAVEVDLVVTSDPRTVEGRFADQQVLRGRVERVASRASAYDVAVPVLVMAPADWTGVVLGERVVFVARLGPSDDRDLSAVLRPLGPAERVEAPAWWWRGAEGVRTSLRASVVDVPADRRPLVPALVVGDDQGLDRALADDFRTTGLTHLLAVSGTNLTLLLGFVLVVARGVGVRGRGLHAVGAAGVVGFVLLARPEPSVLRAAVMGSVALLGLGAGGPRRGGRSLGVAVVVLLLVDPWLAPTAGFALSVLATAGIVFVGPVWRDALQGWLPRWLAEAIAVPAAAQLACTPVVAALSGQVSLVAVVANLLAAPAVGPATVLGLGAGLAGLLWPGLARLVGRLAGWCVAWIVAIARHGAALPLPAVEWGAGAGGLVLLTGCCLVVVVVAPTWLRRPWLATLSGVALALVTLVRLPTPGWPPPGWVVAMCDVGQGDALVLRAGPHEGVVVDAGPDPALVDGCLRRLGVDRVPLVVLTHFHADHVGGLAGVVRGRAVGALQVTPLADPPDAVLDVAAVARRIGAPETVTTFARTQRVGDVTLQVLWPPPTQSSLGPGDGSTANNASVVLLAQVRGVRLLLTGDIEPPGQEALARLVPGLRADVLKVPHHGSRFQDLPWLGSLDARVALVSVGADNDYGHPAEATVAALQSAGAEVLRTDQDGDVVVCERAGHLVVERS